MQLLEQQFPCKIGNDNKVLCEFHAVLSLLLKYQNLYINLYIPSGLTVF